MSYNTSDPKKTTGQFHSMKGNVVEGIGRTTGAQSWQKSGKEEHTRGEREYDAARSKGYVEGAKDHLGGWKDSVLGVMKNDKSQQAQGNVRHDQRQAQQDFNRRV